jgi:hypothetical protein
MLLHFLVAFAFLGLSVIGGMFGYIYFEPDVPSKRDAFLNISMLLGGMGPTHIPTYPGGKVFAGLFALYAGLIFVVATGIVLAPILHRLMHVFHWEESDKN